MSSNPKNIGRKRRLTEEVCIVPLDRVGVHDEQTITEPGSKKCSEPTPRVTFPTVRRTLTLATMLSSLSRLLFVVDDGRNPSRPAGSPSRTPSSGAGGMMRPRSRIMEPAPPTYEEALHFFIRDGNGNSSGNRGQLAITETLANSSAGGNGRNRPSLSEDYEMAERLQQEEIQRCTLHSRERSSSLSAAGPFSGGRPNRNEGGRWSMSSAPGDIRPVPHRSLTLDPSLLSPRGRLRTIPEGKNSRNEITTTH